MHHREDAPATGGDRTPGDREPRGPRARQRGRTGQSEAPDTRARIQAVALELFIKQGYEQTSLREIAERLGVTKAALYYHFRTKDEIVESLTSDRIEKIEELVAWAKEQPRTLETRRVFIIRYAEELHRGHHHDVMRFFESNQISLKDIAAGARMRQRLMEVVHLLSDPSDPLPVQIKGSMALFALHATWFVVRDPAVTDEQRWRAAVDVALELVGARPLDAHEAVASAAG
jgi:AcrR family transcriptional regulator